jgi:lipopolysaccharide export system protein LptC
MSRSGTLFPLLLALTLALLSYWLQAVIDLPASHRPDPTQHDPDTVIDHVLLRSLNPQGELQYRLQATRIEHFPDHDSNEITNPLLTYVRTGAPDLRISSAHADVSQHGDMVLLTGSVYITRDALPNRPELHAKTQTLTVMPNAGTAHTDDPVFITEGNSHLSGVGMSIDNNARTFELDAKVRGEYHPIPRQ